MKNLLLILFALLIVSCGSNNKTLNEKLIGTWELKTSMSIKKDTSFSNIKEGQQMIKMFNNTHFAFFLHDLYKGVDSITNTEIAFISGGGRYTLENNEYTEYLEYCNARDWEGNEFTFHIEINGDTLTQTGIEELEEKGLDEENLKLVEKYIKVKK